MMTWVNIKDRLPEPSDMVLLATEAGWIGHGYYDGGAWVRCEYPDGSGCDEFIDGVRYWFPVPPIAGVKE